jgi:hypothetical protein
MKLVGIIIMLGSIGRFLLPVLGVRWPLLEQISPWWAYAGSLAGGFLWGLGSSGTRESEAEDEAPASAAPSASAEMAPCSNPACGRPIGPGKKFCTACGSPVAKPARKRAHKAKARTCPNPSCGREAAARAKFCTACGTPLSGGG